MKKFQAYAVHTFTALGAVCGLLALYSLYLKDLKSTFLLLAVALIVDGIDGTLARKFDIKHSGVNIDGALLDNIIDYLTYVIVPAFFFLTTDYLLPQWKVPIAASIALASAFQFTQDDAKTSDHFFKGFPDYWNILMFYFYLLNLSPSINTFITGLCVVLIFVPIKYVYPSRPDYVSTNKRFRQTISISTFAWIGSLFFLLFTHPTSHTTTTSLGLIYCVAYLAISLYRTARPLKI